MKKFTCFLIAFILGINLIIAKPVTSVTAQKVAESFIKQNSNAKAVNLSLSYTEKSSSGSALYYVFSLNNSGFIIVTADDAAHPIIAYSYEDNFSIPTANSNIAYWFNKRKSEIETIQTKKLVADAVTAQEWAGNFNTNATNKLGSGSGTQVVAALCQSKWNQNGGGGVPYNNLCPGGSVTGCVATAMAQIMRFWSFPTMGTGSSSYTAGSYGTLSCNYGASTYAWSSMPYTSSNSNVALISYHCGVSVEMNYSPSGSGAYVITQDNPVCAQTSYVQYFGYDPATIQGLDRVGGGYTDPQWITLLENDLTAGRPVQYVGVDPNAGGHTWVCDGFDASNNFHMNWGWGGSSNGYFNINNLAAGGDNFSTGHEALLGIQPKVLQAVDAGIPSITNPIGTICGSSITPSITIKNFGNATLTSCVINYKLDGGANQTQNWNGSLVTNASAVVSLPTISTSAGSHTLTCYSSNPNGGADGNATNDQSVNTFNTNPTGLALPLAEGLEASTSLPSGWTLANPNADAAWQVVTTVAKTGTHCIGFNNCDGDGATDMTGRKDKFITTTYNFSGSASTTLSFDVAYAVLTYSGTAYNDQLQVYYSVDCGLNWTSIYNKSGSTLASAPGYTSIASCWVPTSSNWRNDAINLPGVLGQPSVMFAFENTSAWGTWIYIDNINISSTTTGVSSFATGDFNIYPNPASTSFTIEGADHSGKVNYSIYNMSGQEVKTGEVNSTSNSFKETISVNDLSHGMYFIKLNDEKNSWVRKVSVQ